MHVRRHDQQLKASNRLCPNTSRLHYKANISILRLIKIHKKKARDDKMRLRKDRSGKKKNKTYNSRNNCQHKWIYYVVGSR